MSGALYRQTYRVERRERPLRADEAQLVETQRRAWHAAVRKQEGRPVLEMFVPFAVVLIFIALKDWRVAIAVGVLGTVFFGALDVVTRRKMLQRLAAARGPWDPPEGRFVIQETRVVARSVVGAVSADEDYEHWQRRRERLRVATRGYGERRRRSRLRGRPSDVGAPRHVRPDGRCPGSAIAAERGFGGPVAPRS